MADGRGNIVVQSKKGIVKRVLIQIATEFHYLVALSLVDKYYSGEKYQIHFIIAVNPNSTSRLDKIILDSRYVYHRVNYNHHEDIIFPDVINLKQFIEGNEFYHFISFLFHDPIFVFLTSFFKKKNTVTYLAPDGMGAYVKFKSKNYRSRVINTWKSYKFFKRHGFKFKKLWFTSWDFGRNGYYDYIYAFSKELPNLTDKKIVEVDYNLSLEKLESLKKTFSIDFSSLPELSKVVLIINDKHNLPKYESELIEIISEILPDYKIFFKKHPNQKLENLTYLKKSVFLIDAIFPVELLIASLKDGILISSYSNSMLYRNENCDYFWTYPIVANSGELKKKIERFNPKGYIKVLQNFDEFKENLLNIRNVKE